MVSQAEWTGILNQNPYYRFANRSVTTDSSGRIAISDLSSGTGDSREYFYRMLVGPTDGNVLWRETDLRSVPLGTQSSAQSPSEYLFYLAGDYFQLLPVASGTALTVAVNHVPPTIAQLAGEDSTVVFPTSYEYVAVWTTAGTLFMKGGAETGAAADLFALASDARRRMLADIGRRTTRPSFALFSDSPAAWGG